MLVSVFALEFFDFFNEIFFADLLTFTYSVPYLFATFAASVPIAKYFLFTYPETLPDLTLSQLLFVEPMMFTL